LGYFRTVFRVVLNTFWNWFGSIWDRLGVVRNRLWDRFGNVWEPFGIVIGSLWDRLVRFLHRFENRLEPFEIVLIIVWGRLRSLWDRSGKFWNRSESCVDKFMLVWDRFGGSCWKRFVTVFNRFRITCLWSYWDRFEYGLDPFWIVLGSLWGRFGIVLGSFWNSFGIVLEPLMSVWEGGVIVWYRIFVASSCFSYGSALRHQINKSKHIHLYRWSLDGRPSNKCCVATS
jgi:hypothetical protein